MTSLQPPRASRLVRNPALRELAWSALVAALVVLSLAVFVLPAGFSLALPIVYGDGDSLQLAMYVRRVLDTPWFPFSTNLLGAPFHAAEFDYPENEALNYLLLKGFGVFSGDWLVVSNLYALAGFVLAALSAYGLLRWLTVDPEWAAAGALLFAFLPYHFLRLAPLNHLLLASYWSVPIAAWLALRCWPDNGDEPRPFGDSTSRRAVVAAGIVAVGAAGIYYAFFACFLILVSGASAAIARQSTRVALPAAGTVLAICLVVAIQVSPSLWFRWTQGPNPEAAAREPAESEISGLKIIQLVLPQPNHPLEPARNLAARYHQAAPLSNENQASALGLLGSLGFVLLAAAGFARMARGGGAATTREKLALLTGAAILLGTIGGLGAIFAWTISPLIRSYNRISVFIGLFSIAALVLCLDAATRRIRDRIGAGSPLAMLAAASIGLVGLWDQSTSFDQTLAAAAFRTDREFVTRAEQALPAGTMVYQLPYRPYPEAGPVHRMRDYDHLRGYLHSTGLRWSYGAMKGREGDHWLRALSLRPIAEQLDFAAQSGFGAVYVDRRAYADRGVELATALRKQLGSPVAVSADGELEIYRMHPTGTTPVPIERIAKPLIDPVDFALPAFPGFLARVEGISGREPWGRWTDGPTARFHFALPLPRRFKLELRIAKIFGPNRASPILVRVGDEVQTFVVTEPGAVTLSFDLRRSASTIEFVIPHPISPQSLGQSADRRLLGVGFESLRIVPGA